MFGPLEAPDEDATLAILERQLGKFPLFLFQNISVSVLIFFLRLDLTDCECLRRERPINLIVIVSDPATTKLPVSDITSKLSLAS